MRRIVPALALWLAVVAAPALCAGDGWQTLAGPALLPVASSWEQVWGKVAVAPDGSRYATAWATTVGHNVFVRFFDADGTPTSGDLLANEGLTQHRQDEPMLAMDAAGNTLVCWSDRKGYDGDGMGVYGRVFDPAGVALGPPFVISEDWTESQWEPMPVALPGGGWLVAYNGEDDGEAWFRRLAVNGTPLTGDINMSTFHNNAQVDATVAVTQGGVVLAVFVDYGGNVAPGTGTNVFVRRFLPDGTAIDAGATLAHPTALLFDQIDPRVAVNTLPGAFAVFSVVWQDGGNDGSGQGIFARRFKANGTALGPEFQVNTTTLGDQLLPEVDCDHVGNTIYTWEDRSTGVGRILARVYDPSGVATTGELVVSADTGNHRRPQVRLTRAGERAFFAYDGPGLFSNPSAAQDRDAYVVRWQRPALRFDAPATLGTNVPISVDLPGGGGLFRLVLASFGQDGIALPDGRSLPLSLDLLFDHSLLYPGNGLPFLSMSGVLPVDGCDLAGIVLPPNPILLGLPLHFAVLTLDLQQFGLTSQLRHVSRPATLIAQ